MTTMREELLAEIEQFLETHRMRATTFGREALKDTAFVSRLRAGREPMTYTIDRVRAYLAAHSSPRKPRRTRGRPKSSPARALVAA